MIIKSLKARILRALKSSSLPAADSSPSPPPSPTKPGAVRVAPHAADASSDDASFFDAREADDDTPTTKAEPLDAWELVDDQSDDDDSPADASDDAAPPTSAADADPGLLLLLGLPARCPPPGGESAVVLYTTTLRGVRRTFEDCNAVRALLENLGAAFQERDVSLDRGLRDQLWAAAGEKAVPPRLFVRGREAGGAAQVLALHEDGRLAPLLLLGGGGAGAARQGDGFGPGGRSEKCGACGGLRFVVCGACDGSRKQAAGGARCPRCNENGLAVCPLCAAV